MKRKFTILLIILSASIHTLAQRLYQEGYVVTNTGDTLKGKVDNKKWAQTPREIHFVSQALGEVVYRTEDLKGFAIDNEVVYVRKKMDLDVSPFALSKLLTTSERIIVKDTTLFLRKIVSGRLSLFYTKDQEEKNHFFIQKFEEPLEELIDHHFIKTVDDRKFTAHWDLYNHQLLQLCQDCSLYEGKTFKYAFTESTLTSLILSYNRFFGDSQPVVASKKDKFKTNFYLKTGFSKYSYLAEKYDSYGPYYSYEKSDLSCFSLGLGLFAELPSFRRRVGINIEALYSTYAEGLSFSSNFEIARNKTYLGVYLLPTYAVYKNVPKQIDVFLEAGGSIEIPLNKSNINYVEEGSNEMYGYTLGVGAKVKRVKIELNYYSNTAGLQQFLVIGGRINRLGVNVSYALKK